MATKLAYDQFMPNMYTVQKDLNDRLDGTIVRYKGIPYSCRVRIDTDGSIVLWLFDLAGQKHSSKPDLTIKPNDPLLDISILESMYTNYQYKLEDYELPQRACWITRNTAKHYKSGTYCGYTNVRTIDGKNSGEFESSTVMFTPTFVSAVLGQYPALEPQLELFKSMKRKEWEVAIDQRVALKRESIGLVKVYIDTRIVGWLDGQDRIVVTNDDRRWVIRRMLEPLGFKV